MADAAKKLKENLPKFPSTTGSRPMKFPYTFSAKVAQFPYKFYFQNCWVFRYYCYALLVCIPIFNSISKMSNSPASVAKWEEALRKDAEESHHH